jgi:hypothetical protein
VVLQGQDLPGQLLAAAGELMAHPVLLASLARPEANRAVALCLDDLVEFGNPPAFPA